MESFCSGRKPDVGLDEGGCNLCPELLSCVIFRTEGVGHAPAEAMSSSGTVRHFMKHGCQEAFRINKTAAGRKENLVFTDSVKSLIALFNDGTFACQDHLICDIQIFILFPFLF